MVSSGSAIGAMKISRTQAILASIAILGAAVLAEVLAPRELLASASAGVNLERDIPKQFGDWTYVPSVGLVTPTEAPDFVQPDANSSRIYSQEVGRGYVNRQGQLVMLLVAYGPVQNYRLKAHRPEICYTAAGFRVSRKFGAQVEYPQSKSPLKMTRLITERETRFEPVSYWMRVGDDVAAGIIERQLIRLRYGLRGIIPDGALVRVSTVGVPSADTSYKLQDQFIRDLISAVEPNTRQFLIGAHTAATPVAVR